MTAFEYGLRAALDIAEREERKWLKEAADHARNYWGGIRSDYAKSDMKRAKIARRIANKIELQIKEVTR
jgi:hypothetical protein